LLKRKRGGERQCMLLHLLCDYVTDLGYHLLGE
jgi:hypothetical protein